jgi:hypothetical protein
VRAKECPGFAGVVQQTTVSVLVTEVRREHSFGWLSGTLKEYIESRKPSLVVVKKRAPSTFPFRPGNLPSPVPSHPIPSHPIPLHPIAPHPIPSHLAPSHTSYPIVPSLPAAQPCLYVFFRLFVALLWCRWAQQILQGLDYLHTFSPPIAHRNGRFLICNGLA